MSIINIHHELIPGAADDLPRAVRTAEGALRGTRIIFVFNSLELGGAERQAIHLAAYLKRTLNAHVEIWGFSGPGRASELCASHGIPTLTLKPPLKGNPLSKAAGMGRFILELRRAKADLVLPYTMAQNILCALTWWLSGARLCVWNQRDEGRKRVGRMIERLAVGLTPLFLSNSQHGAEFLTHHAGADPRRVFVVRNGVVPASPTVGRVEWRRDHGLSEDGFVACMVANLHHFKDHATLLWAWRRVLDEPAMRDKHPVLLLAGRFDDATDAVKAQINELRLGDGVRLLGGVGDVTSLLGATDLCVFSSRMEGCPNGILESMAAGLAVVASDIEGVREALGDRKEHVLSSPGDDHVMADNIVRLALDPSLRAELGAANRQRVQLCFEVDRMCRETALLLAKALQRQV